MDAANVDLKAFTERFYRDVTKSRLADVLETLRHIHNETTCWLEITTLLIPGENDGEDEIRALSAWIARELSPDVPLHFSAFHPDHRMLDKPRTPHATLYLARNVAKTEGLRHVYVGNVHDPARQSSWCHACGARTVRRDWHQVSDVALDGAGRCLACGTAMPGVFDGPPGDWGRQRRPVDMARYA
jgi:pyruvate formate lyase activating enzyme